MSIFTNNQITPQACLEELVSYDSDFMREWVAQRIDNRIARTPLKRSFSIKDNTFINKYKKTPIPLVMGMNCMFNTTLIEYIVLN